MTEKDIYDEHALLLQTAAGNEQAFTLLVNNYRKNIYTSSLRLLHSSVLAEETLQDVFLKVWLQRNELPDIENFLPGSIVLQETRFILHLSVLSGTKHCL